MRAMKRFYGWTIVGVGILVTCVGFGAMLSLSIFLRPMSEAMGWSRTGISTAALLTWLCMGAGSFLWGALSDRLGTRTVLLIGGGLLGVGLVSASQASTLGQFQILFGLLVGLASGAFYAPLTATTTRWFTQHRSLAVALVSAGTGLGASTVGPLARFLITSYDWRLAMLVIGNLAWLLIIPAALLVREPPSGPSSAGAGSLAGAGGLELTAAQALRTPQFVAIALTNFACCAAHSGPIFHMVTHAIDRGVPAMAAVTVLSVAGLSSLAGKIICGLVADRVGARRTLIVGLVAGGGEPLHLHPRPRQLLRAGRGVRLRVRWGDAALRDPGPRVLRGPDHGNRVRRRRAGLHPGHGPRAVGRRLALRHVRQLLLAVHRLVRHRSRSRGHRHHVPPARLGPGRDAESKPGPRRVEGVTRCATCC
jgi:MFS family permease